MDWASEYRPKHITEVVGNSSALHQMVAWAREWTPESKPLLLYGKPGTGKTSSAYALATDFQWEVIELNASDQRTRDVIRKVAGTSSTTGTLSGAVRKLILLDEADNLHGTADRGGARAIIEVIASSRQPIILIANDLYQLAPEIRARCEPVQFKALPARSIVPRLRYICSAEHLACSDEALKGIADAASGDMRAAITMLEAAAIGRDTLGEPDVATSRKDERSSVFTLVSAVYGKTRAPDLMRIASEVDETPDTLAQWIEANVHAIHDRDRYIQAYHCLSRSDEYIGRTYRQQYYTLWRYATALMVLGVSGAAGGGGIHARINAPERWKKMAGYRRQKGIRTTMLGKLGRSLHLSQYLLRDTYLTPVSLLADRDPLSFARDFALDTDELTLLIHDKAKAQRAVKALREEEKALLKEHTRIEQEQAKKAASAPAREDKPRPVVEKAPDPGPRAETPPPSPEDTKQEESRSQKTLFDGF